MKNLLSKLKNLRKKHSFKKYAKNASKIQEVMYNTLIKLQPDRIAIYEYQNNNYSMTYEAVQNTASTTIKNKQNIPLNKLIDNNIQSFYHEIFKTKNKTIIITIEFINNKNLSQKEIVEIKSTINKIENVYPN